MAYNKVVLVGRLVTDPTLRRTGNGHAVTSFRLAVDRQTRDETDFFDIVAWRASAEFAEKYFAKGQEVLVEGKMQNRRWQDKDGNDRITTEVVVDQFAFVGSKMSKDSNEGTNNSFTPIDDDDEGLPF